jgi:hypothetical protein
VIGVVDIFSFCYFVTSSKHGGSWHFGSVEILKKIYCPSIIISFQSAQQSHQ